MPWRKRVAVAQVHHRHTKIVRLANAVTSQDACRCEKRPPSDLLDDGDGVAVQLTKLAEQADWEIAAEMLEAAEALIVTAQGSRVVGVDPRTAHEDWPSKSWLGTWAVTLNAEAMSAAHVGFEVAASRSGGWEEFLVVKMIALSAL